MHGLKAAAAVVLVSTTWLPGVWAQDLSALPIPAPPAPPRSSSPPTYTITLHTRHACVTPHSRKLARAEGGYIDVLTTAPNTLAATMTGTTAANSYLCTTGEAGEKFELVQDFEIACSDPSVKMVSLTLDTSLVGFVRSKGRAGACVRKAEVCITPAGLPGMPLTQAYPPLCVEGTGGQLCNQHLPPLEVPALPVGRYTMTASFVLDTRAAGVCDSHAVADFSPDTALPPEWVRTRDPFQGVSKRSFGFTATLSASPPSTPDPGRSSADRNRQPSRLDDAVPPGGLADRRTPS